MLSSFLCLSFLTLFLYFNRFTLSRSYYSANAKDGIVILDAFCGCGGNAIAFGKLSPFSVSQVVCCDIDIVKLRYAAYNAAVYGIPCDKLLFVLCNSLYVMDQCYRAGELIQSALDRHDSALSFREEFEGFTIGSLDLLPPHIDAVFMDPPWGGVNYSAAGKNGYDLSKNMKIRYDLEAAARGEDIVLPACISGGGNDDIPSESGTIVDGSDLLAMAALATKGKFVAYDIPRNTNKMSIARAALAAGYRGNLKLEEYYLNGRLKTATAFMGWDYGPSGRASMVNPW